MKIVQMYQTDDGALHKTHADATRHWDRVYGDVVTSLAHDMVHVQKYKDAVPWIEARIDEFAKLAKIRDGFKVTKDDDCYCDDDA